LKYTNGNRKRLAMGSIAALSMGVTGCGQSVPDPLPLPDTPVQFENATECIAAGYEITGCENGYQASLMQHQEEAPRYQKQQECEDEWGPTNCQEVARSGGGSSFMPFYMGYLLARSSNSSRRGYYRNGNAYGSPIYRSRNGPVQYQRNRNEESRSGSSAFIGGGSSAGATGRQAYTTVPVTAPKPANVASKSVSRGGFGSSSGSRGSWGG